MDGVLDAVEGVVLPESWWDLRGDGVEDVRQREFLAAELVREAGFGHPLRHGRWGRRPRWTVVARCDARDDVLLSLADGRAALVHLTYAQRPEPLPWPITTFVSSTEELTRLLNERE